MQGRCHNSEEGSVHHTAAQPCGRAFDYDRSLARLGGNPDLFAEIVVLFLEDAPELVTRARDCLNRKSLLELERAAHSLKGLSANFDATQLVSAASSLETMAREQDLERAAECFPELEREFTRLQTELQAFRDSIRH
jgi:two-component system, sensor histidine kinase and response regulator